MFKFLGNFGGRVKRVSEDRALSSSLDENIKVVNEIFDRCGDLIIREFMIGQNNPVRAMAVFFDPLIRLETL